MSDYLCSEEGIRIQQFLTHFRVTKSTKQATDTGHRLHFILKKINQALSVEYNKSFEQTERVR